MHLQIMPLSLLILMLFIFACFQYTNHLPSHIMHSRCNNSFHNQFMRFKHIHNNPITLVNIGYSIYNFWRIPFDKSHPYYHSVMCLYIYNSISHQDGCRLVHPAKWDISSMPYTIMTDADWCIPPNGTLENFGVPS